MADARFLTHAAAAFSGVAPDLPWLTLELSTTYRLTGCITAFVNAHVVGADLYRTGKEMGDPVRYYKGNKMNVAKTLLAHLLDLLTDKCDAEGNVVPAKYTPGDIYLLTDSLEKGNREVRECFNAVVNGLIDNSIPCGSYHTRSELKAMPGAVADSGDGKLQNHVVFSTAHKVKGLERKLVVVFNFAGAFFWDNVPASGRVKCPKELYMGESAPAASCSCL